MPISMYETVIDGWLTTHDLPLVCPVCGSSERRIDLNPPALGTWRPRGGGKSGSQYVLRSAPPARVEITCLACASVRVFDAGTMGVP